MNPQCYVKQAVFMCQMSIYKYLFTNKGIVQHINNSNYNYIYSFILKYYTYVSRPITILIYVTVTYLFVTMSQFPSVSLVLALSLLAAFLSQTCFSSYLYRKHEMLISFMSFLLKFKIWLKFTLGER